MLKSPPQNSASMSIGSVPKICESCVMGTEAVAPHQGPSLQSESHQGEGVNSPCLLDSFQISHISPGSQWSSAWLALAQPSRQPLLNEYELLRWLQTTSCVTLGKSFDFSRHLLHQILFFFFVVNFVIHWNETAIKKNSFESVLMRWMKLEPIIQSEVSQKDKDHYNILTHIYGI